MADIDDRLGLIANEGLLTQKEKLTDLLQELQLKEDRSEQTISELGQKIHVIKEKWFAMHNEELEIMEIMKTQRVNHITSQELREKKAKIEEEKYRLDDEERQHEDEIARIEEEIQSLKQQQERVERAVEELQKKLECQDMRLASIFAGVGESFLGAPFTTQVQGDRKLIAFNSPFLKSEVQGRFHQYRNTTRDVIPDAISVMSSIAVRASENVTIEYQGPSTTMFINGNEKPIAVGETFVEGGVSIDRKDDLQYNIKTADGVKLAITDIGLGGYTNLNVFFFVPEGIATELTTSMCGSVLLNYQDQNVAGVPSLFRTGFDPYEGLYHQPFGGEGGGDDLPALQLIHDAEKRGLLSSAEIKTLYFYYYNSPSVVIPGKEPYSVRYYVIKANIEAFERNYKLKRTFPKKLIIVCAGTILTGSLIYGLLCLLGVI
jgi:hypothetical protein